MTFSITRKIGWSIAAVAIAGLACTGLAFAVAGSPEANTTTPKVDEPQLLEGSYYDGDGDEYRVDANGVVYELDKGVWEAEKDLKITDGQVYELENGVWQLKDVRTDSSASNAAQSDAVQSGAAHSGAVQSSEPANGSWEPENDKKVEDGVFYEYDDGAWEAENDVKIENGTVYEYDDGSWEVENDMKVDNGVVYEYEEYDDSDDDADDDGDDEYDDD